LFFDWQSLKKEGKKEGRRERERKEERDRETERRKKENPPHVCMCMYLQSHLDFIRYVH